MSSFEDDVEEKSIADGIGFFWRWTLACGVYKQYYICRVLEPVYSKLITEDAAISHFEVDGNVMKEMICIDPKRVEEDEELVILLMMGVTHTHASISPTPPL